MISTRSNIHRLPDLTDQQVLDRLARSQAEQAEFFRKFGLVVVPTRGTAPDLPRLLQMAVEAWARARFKKTNSSIFQD